MKGLLTSDEELKGLIEAVANQGLDAQMTENLSASVYECSSERKGLSEWLSFPTALHAGWQAGTACSARPGWRVQHEAIQPLPALPPRHGKWMRSFLDSNLNRT